MYNDLNLYNKFNNFSVGRTKYRKNNSELQSFFALISKNLKIMGKLLLWLYMQMLNDLYLNSPAYFEYITLSVLFILLLVNCLIIFYKSINWYIIYLLLCQLSWVTFYEWNYYLRSFQGFNERSNKQITVLNFIVFIE